MKTRFLATLLTIVISLACVGATPKNSPTKWDKLTCEEVVELFNEMGFLYAVSSVRLSGVTGEYPKKLWMELKLLTLQNRDSLAEARAQKCRQL